MAKKSPTKKPASKAASKKSASTTTKAKAPAKPKAAKAATKAASSTTKKTKKATAKADKASSAETAAKPKGKAKSKKAAAAAGTEVEAKAKATKKTKAATATTKKAAKESGTSAKAEKAADSKKAKGGSKGASASSKKAAGGAGADGSTTPAFMTEPGPRFRSPFANSAGSAKEAAARMAEAAGLTAIRAASVTKAPAMKKFKKITASPLPDKQLEEFRELLTEKRDQLVGDVSSMEREALGGDGGSLSRLPQHMADQGTDTYDQSLNLDLAASQRGIVKEIDAALSRIDAKTFGVCELLGKPIGIDRLRNAPWTRYSIEAARMLELNPELARAGSGVSDDDEDSDDEV